MREYMVRNITTPATTPITSCTAAFFMPLISLSFVALPARVSRRAWKLFY